MTLQTNSPLTWKGIYGTLQAWQETPDGILLYCKFNLGGTMKVYWIKSDEVKMIEPSNHNQD